MAGKAAVAEEAAVAGEAAVAREATVADESAVVDEAVARRTPTGWRVGGEEVPDLTSAMVLADLLAADLPSDDQWQAPGGAANAPRLRPTRRRYPGRRRQPRAPLRPGRPRVARGRGDAGTQDAGTQDSTTHGAGRKAQGHTSPTHQGGAEQLKETVAQLERALTVRVRVEQAIGVLAERHRLRPRQAFELLRSASRARGARVSQTAGEVVASVTNPLLRIPEELARQPEGHRGRSSRHPRRKA